MAPEKKQHLSNPVSESEREIGRLFERAGRRPELPREELESIEHRVRAQWRELYGHRAGTLPAGGWRAVLAVGLLMTALLAVGWWLSLRERPTEGLADSAWVVERVSGAVMTTLPGPAREESGSAHVGQELPVGTRILTLDVVGGPTRAALAAPAGVSIRLDVETRLRIAAPQLLELEAGAVYVDSPAYVGSELEIRTPFGTVRELGTQFEVRLLETEAAALRVRVREGRVLVDGPDDRREAAAGSELVLDSDGRWTEAELSPIDESWRWVLETAPGFDVEGRTIAELLAWVGRETGWQIVYADPALAAAADEIVIRGAFEDLRPDEAHELVLPAAGLTARQLGDRLEVERSRTSPSGRARD